MYWIWINCLAQRLKTCPVVQWGTNFLVFDESLKPLNLSSSRNTFKMKHNTTEVVLSSPVNYFLGDQTHKTISKRFLKVFEFVMGLQYVLILSKANFLTCVIYVYIVKHCLPVEFWFTKAFFRRTEGLTNTNDSKRNMKLILIECC
jgi:hypothetical protein